MVDSRYPAPPRIRSVPDTGFAHAVGLVMAERPWIDDPAELEEALRLYFARAEVLRVDHNASAPTWYVYRDGRPPTR